MHSSNVRVNLPFYSMIKIFATASYTHTHMLAHLKYKYKYIYLRKYAHRCANHKRIVVVALTVVFICKNWLYPEMTAYDTLSN